MKLEVLKQHRFFCCCCCFLSLFISQMKYQLRYLDFMFLELVLSYIYKILLNIPMLIYLGLFSPAVAELIVCDTDHTVY